MTAWLPNNTVMTYANNYVPAKLPVNGAGVICQRKHTTETCNDTLPQHQPQGGSHDVLSCRLSIMPACFSLGLQA